MFNTSRPWGQTKPPVGSQVDWGDPISQNLAGCWMFNERSGGKIFDATKRYDGVTTLAWVQGKFGNTLKHVGGTSYVALACLTGTLGLNRTVSAWAQTTATTGNPCVWGDDRRGIIRFDSGVLTLYAYDTNYRSATKSGVNDGRWHHIVGVINTSGAEIRLYVDGVSVNSAVFGTLDQGTFVYNAKIGANYSLSDTPIQYFVGLIDNVRLYNRALRSSEVSRLYTEPFAGIQPYRRRFYSIPAAVGGFQAAWARQRPGIIGAR